MSDQLTHITVRHRAKTGPARVAWAIRAARGWLGEEVEPVTPSRRRYQADLRLRVSEKPSLVTFRKAAYIDIGPIKSLGDGWEVDISWRASTLAPLFPVFSGKLDMRQGQVTLSGWYAPPGGTVGRLADAALLHLAAEGTARWLLGALDEAATRGDV